MKIKRLAIITVIAILMMSTSVFAQQTAKVPAENSTKEQKENKAIDPIKRLEDKKAEIQKRLSEGKITKEEADSKTQKINSIIAKINEFEKLTIEQKRDVLVKEFSGHMNKMVQEGKLTKEEADKKIGDFKDKINKWDGKGYPMFFRKGHGRPDGEKGEGMKFKLKDNLGRAVKDGKITQKQADSLMEYFKD